MPADFERAAAAVTRLSAEGHLPEADLLQLYALYKQTTVGACNTARPGVFSVAARRKWDAWRGVRALEPRIAARSYVEKLTSLVPDWAEGEAAALPRGLGIAVSTLRAQGDGEEAEGDGSVLDLVKAGDVDSLAALPADATDWEAPDEERMCLIHWAADRGHAAVVRLLLARGAGVDARDADGQTPLHYAACCQHAEVVRALVEAGAHVLAQDADGQTPAQVANEHIRQLMTTLHESDVKGV